MLETNYRELPRLPQFPVRPVRMTSGAGHFSRKFPGRTSGSPLKVVLLSLSFRLERNGFLYQYNIFCFSRTFERTLASSTSTKAFAYLLTNLAKMKALRVSAVKDQLKWRCVSPSMRKFKRRV